MNASTSSGPSWFWRVVFLLGLIHAGFALLETFRYSFPLRWYLGGGFTWLALGLVAATGIVLAALVREARPTGSARGLPRRVAFYVFVVHFVVVHASFQPYRKLVFDQTVVFAFGALAVLRWLGPTLARRIPRRGLRVADIGLMNVGILLVAIELGLRATALVFPSPFLSQGTERAEDRIDRYRYEPGRLRYGFPVNESGYYDEPVTPKASGEPLVVSIGDSFAAGVVPHYYHFTTVIERELPGVRVHNLGVPAIGVPEYLFLLRYEALALDPDALLVNLFVGNDVKPKTVPAEEHRWQRSWYERKNLLTFLVPKRLASVAREQAAMRDAGNTDGMLQGESGAENAKTSPAEIAKAFPWVLDPSKERPFLSDDGVWRNELKAVREGWLEADDVYRSLFAYLDEIADAAGDVPLVFALIPDRCQVDDALWSRLCRRYPELATRRDEPQERIARWCEENGVLAVDLLPALRAEPPLADGQPHLYHRNDTHFNARGNRVAGETLARFLEPLLARESKNE